jgi:hypothetical protein
MHNETLAVLLSAAGVEETSVNLLTFIPQLIIGVLSVPLVVTAITAIFRFLSPSTRLSSRLRRDLDLLKDMPIGSARDGFEAHINRTTRALSSRYEPRTTGTRLSKFYESTSFSVAFGAVGVAATVAASIFLYMSTPTEPVEDVPASTENLATLFSVLVGAAAIVLPILGAAGAAVLRRILGPLRKGKRESKLIADQTDR